MRILVIQILTMKRSQNKNQAVLDGLQIDRDQNRVKGVPAEKIRTRGNIAKEKTRRPIRNQHMHNPQRNLELEVGRDQGLAQERPTVIPDADSIQEIVNEETVQVSFLLNVWVTRGVEVAIIRYPGDRWDSKSIMEGDQS